MKIVFTDKISPFEIAFYDIEAKRTFIDSRMRGMKCLDYLLSHEKAHSQSDNLIDWDVEKSMSFDMTMNLLRMKPLWLFSLIMPFAWVRYKGKLEYGLVPYRLAFLAFLVLMIIVILYIGMVI